MDASMDSFQDPFNGQPSGLWNDFWQELVGYLSPRAIYHLSCVSRSLNKIAWAQFIPVCGMCLREETLPKYLSRPAFLSKLSVGGNLKSPKSLKILQQKVPKLKTLDFVEDISDLHAGCLIWLTNLESLGTRGYQGTAKPLLAFKSLKDLRIADDDCDCDDLLPTLALMTQLTSLRAPLQATFIPTLSGLTNLVSFGFARSECSSFSLPQTWQKLTSIFLFECDTPKNIQFFTNLKELRFLNVNLPDQRIVEITSFLTNLETLSLSQGCEGYESFPKVDFSCLTNLTSLDLDFCDFPPGAVRNLPSLTRLNSLEITLAEPEVYQEVLTMLHEMTSLSNLVVPTQYWEFLATHTKLQVLELSYDSKNNPSPGMFGYLSHLTNLQELRLLYYPIPASSAHYFQGLANNLKTLRVIRDVDQALEHLSFLTNLTELKLSFAENFTPAGIVTISKAFTQLRTLHLDWSEGDEEITVKSLRPLLDLPYLNFVSRLTRDTNNWPEYQAELRAQDKRWLRTF